ncbi:cell adhesion molecule DSCAM-like [Uloborus diversus]|uniref:cell adhesion molecule DSCAM-like n=1 Tax=Uloborus diversus TaxID=327109 RepID=UPI0024096E53|nr:cell adhesion molecule DSCAM-like [Uloborus diversus]
MRTAIFWIILGALDYAISSENTGAPVLQPFSLSGPVVRGQTVALTCAVTSGRGPFTFRWTDQEGLPLATPSPAQSEYSLLLLRAVDGRKAGNYTCHVSNADGSTSQAVEISVNEPPEWILLPEDTEVVSGSDLRMDCFAKGTPEPDIVWKKKKAPASLPLNTGGRRHVMSNGTMLVQDARAEDGGLYECSASNGVGEELRKTVKVTVHEPPHFQEVLGVERARSGNSVVLRCDVTGDTPLRVTWTRDYMDVWNDRYKVQETPLPNGLMSELSIFRAIRKDAGLYTCSATNSYGQQQRTVKLIILEPPSSPSEVQVRDVKRTEVTVQWVAPHSGNSPILRYLLQYWRDTGGPPKLEEASIRGEERRDHVLEGLKPGTSYIVRLIAENEFGASPPSIPVRFSTQEERPSGYPTDLMVFSRGLNHLIIRWKAPAPDQQNGAIRGYELGFREVGGAHYEYRATPLSPGSAQEFVLQDLREDTEYEVVVRAHNQAGQGPPSVPLFARTRRRGQLSTPKLKVESTGASTMTLTWSGNENVQDAHYLLYYRPAGGVWRERTALDGSGTTLTDLRPDTLYEVYVQAVSGQDYSPPSETVSAKTTAPAARSPLLRSQLSPPSQGGLPHTTLVISLSVVISCVIIVCIIAASCVYVTRFTTTHSIKSVVHNPTELCEGASTSRSTPLSRHTFRYVDVHSRPLMYCSTPAPAHVPSDDYPSPYATLPLRHTSMGGKRWQSDDRVSSERSEDVSATDKN